MKRVFLSLYYFACILLYFFETEAFFLRTLTKYYILPRIVDHYIRDPNIELSYKISKWMVSLDPDALNIMEITEKLNRLEQKKYSYAQVKHLLDTKVNTALRNEVKSKYPEFLPQFKWRPYNNWYTAIDGPQDKTIYVSTSHILAIIRDKPSLEWGCLAHEKEHAEKGHRAQKEAFVLRNQTKRRWFPGAYQRDFYDLCKQGEREADRAVPNEYLRDMGIYFDKLDTTQSLLKTPSSPMHDSHADRSRAFFQRHDQLLASQASPKAREILGIT